MRRNLILRITVVASLCLFASSCANAAEMAGGRTWPAWIAGILFLGTLLGLVVLGYGPNMLRDPLPAGVTAVRPFSLGKVQMAWWFIIIVGSYLYIWAITGAAPQLSPTLLSLAGISGATGATAAAISSSQQTQFPPHKDFFYDLVTDKDGVTLHRFQMLAMTIILGIMFIIEVMTNDMLPTNFDGTTLGLMGISAGTYLGFKIPEKQS
jgi:hypothetical protein